VVLVAIVHGLEFAAVDGDDGVGEKVQTTAQCNNWLHTALIAAPLSRRKSAMVLKSGISRRVSHITSRLRRVSRSSRRLDWFRYDARKTQHRQLPFVNEGIHD